MKWSGHFLTITFYKLRPTLTIKASFNKSLRNLLQQISPQIFIARRVLWKRLQLSSSLIVILVLIVIFIIIDHYWKHVLNTQLIEMKILNHNHNLTTTIIITIMVDNIDYQIDQSDEFESSS